MNLNFRSPVKVTSHNQSLFIASIVSFRVTTLSSLLPATGCSKQWRCVVSPTTLRWRPGSHRGRGLPGAAGIYDPGLASPPPTPPQCNVPILTPSPPPPCGCGLWLFLWVGNVALVLALPHNDRCGVIRGSQRRGTWMGQTK